MNSIIRWVIVMIIAPLTWTFIVASGAFARPCEYCSGGWSSPDGLDFFAFVTVAIAVYGLFQLLHIAGSMAYIVAVERKQDSVIKVYEDQLSGLKEDAQAVIDKVKENAVVSDSIPATEHIEQIGNIREKLAKAQLRKANVEVDIEEWATGVFSGLAKFFLARARSKGQGVG